MRSMVTVNQIENTCCHSVFHAPQRVTECCLMVHLVCLLKYCGGFTFCGPCMVIYLRNEDQQDALSLHISIIYPVQVLNRVTIRHQEAVTEYAAFGIYHASVLTSC